MYCAFPDGAIYKQKVHPSAIFLFFLVFENLSRSGPMESHCGVLAKALASSASESSAPKKTSESQHSSSPNASPSLSDRRAAPEGVAPAAPSSDATPSSTNVTAKQSCVAADSNVVQRCEKACPAAARIASGSYLALSLAATLSKCQADG